MAQRDVVDFLKVTVAVTVAVVLALVQPPLRLVVTRITDRLVYRGRYNPARALRDYGDAINNIVDLNTLSSVAVGIVADALDVRRGVLMLISSRDDLIYDVVILEGMGALTTSVGTFTSTSSIFQFLRAATKPLTQYEIDILPEYRVAPAVERHWLHALDMEVYVPIREKDVGIPAKCEGPAGFAKVWGEMDTWAKPHIEAEKAKAKK